MTDPKSEAPKATWRFPKTFWFANTMELCERAAYYGFFIMLTVYLSSVVGFSDSEAGIIAGIFSGTLYLLPPFAGIIADRIGFRRAMLLAFSLLTLGYTLLGVSQTKTSVCVFLVILVCGSAFIKPLITGTVAKTSTEANRARAFSLFYWTVNIGAFLGKTVIPFVRQSLGLEYINFFSAIVCAIALLIALFFYNPQITSEAQKGETKTFAVLFKSLGKILTNGRLMALTIIIAGFWTVQQQLYASMPKYVIRTVGENAKPEWIANVNPLVVVISVILITQLMRKHKAITSMTIGMFIMPISAFLMSLGPWFQNMYGDSFLGMHPFTVMLVGGIAFQGLAECFISPRFLEFFSLQAPKGEEGVYLGFSHLHSFFSAILGFFISGFLLEKYCPDPQTLPQDWTAAQIAERYAEAHYIWYYFVGIALVAGIALVIYTVICRHIDQKRDITKQQTSTSDVAENTDDSDKSQAN